MKLFINIYHYRAFQTYIYLSIIATHAHFIQLIIIVLRKVWKSKKKIDQNILTFKINDFKSNLKLFKISRSPSVSH